MRVGVPKEIKDGEKRVGVVPAGVRQLVDRGHEVRVEVGAGDGSGFSDADYAAQGADIVEDPDELWAWAQMVVKVKEPLPAEYGRLDDDLVLFTYLHLASGRALTEALIERGTTAVAYETIEDRKGALPLLKPMSEVAGRLGTQVGATALQSDNGGRGVLLGGVPGVAPAEVVVIGGGTSGFNAAIIARGMGAHVTVLDINHDRLQYLDDITQGTMTTVYSDPLAIHERARRADLLVSAVLIPGAKAPRLVTREMVRDMPRGSVIVDIAIDQGGAIEGIRPTSHSDPTYVEDGVIHYAVPNIPALVPRTSTIALTNATIGYAVAIADHGLDGAIEARPGMAAGVNVRDGRLVHPKVMETFPDLPGA